MDGAGAQALSGCLWDTGAVLAFVCFYAFLIPPVFSLQNKNTVQVNFPTRYFRRKRGQRPAGIRMMLAKTAKKGYTYPSGADLIRCVGGLFTCAGTGELAFPCTAVIFVFLSIL